jgi:hypothetical protein
MPPRAGDGRIPTSPPPCYNRGMSKGTSWALVVGLLVIFGLAAYAVTQSVKRSTEPIAGMSAAVGTQVSELLNPTPTVRPDPVTIVREVRALARLETIQYSVEKVLTGEINQGALAFLFGDRLLFVAHGVVIAGVDMGKIGPDDVWIDEQGRVYMRLPEPEIFVATLDNDKSYVYDRDTGLFTHGDLNLEATVRRSAEDEIRQAAIDDGILDQARVNAENYLYRLLRTLEFDDVIFVPPETGSPTEIAPTPIPQLQDEG